MRSRIASTALAVAMTASSLNGSWASPARAQGARSRVAIVRLDVRGNVPEAGRELFASHLADGLAAGSFDVVRLAVSEARLDATDLADCRTPACFPAVARELGVEFLVVGTIVESGKSYTLGVELVGGQTGTLTVAGRERCETCGIAEAAERMALAASALRARLEAMASTPARMVVRSNPAGATVTLDGRPVGKTPVDLEVAAGRHGLRLTAPGHVPLERTLSAVGGIEEELDLRLEPEASTFPFRTVGWASLGAGALALAGGLWALSIDGKEIACTPAERDAANRCPFVRNGGTWAAVLMGVGATAFTLGGVSLYLGRDRGPAGDAGTSVSLVSRGRF